MGAVIKTSGLVGLLTGAVALGVAELAAAVTGPNGAPVIAVGETAINLTPVPVKEFAIAHFGTHDKEALVTGIVVLLAAFAAGIGVLAVPRLAYGLAALAVFAAVGVAAAVSLPAATGSDVVPTLVGAAVAAVTLVLLVRTVRRVGRPQTAEAADQPAELADQPAELADQAAGGAGTDRRRFLVVGAGAAALGVAAGGLGNALLGRFSIAPGQVRLPGPAVPAAAVPAGADFRIPGLTPFRTSNASFYRVDTDLTRLTLTTFARQQAYWTQRGYAAQAPIKTESRIDVPKPLAQVKAGRTAVAGMAWAPATGIAAVEVSVDSGPWQRARLAAADGIDTWRQWMWAWDARPGLHQLQVRATDNSGVTQTPRRVRPVPNGASGWDSVVVTVT